jgi:hypothetical protein
VAFNKKVQNGSIIWKYILNAFPLIGKWLIWKIGNGAHILIGKDPWIGSKDNHLLPENMVCSLNEGGFYYLSQVMRRDYVTRQVWWMSWKELGLR